MMFVVIFEVQPKPERWDEYLTIAKGLKPELEAIDGFIDNDRFESRRTKGLLLSLSTWRDEKAVIRWRTHALHHKAQTKGRFNVFADYHLRVGEITADSQPPAGLSVVEARFDATAVGVAKMMTITDLISPAGSTAKPSGDIGLDSATPGLVSADVFDSIYTPGKAVLLAGWRDADAAKAWTPAAAPGQSLRHRGVRIIRDYGMASRDEAPQYFPDVERAKA
jgi:heme-degrading monooxygenase HmoA